MTVEELLKSDGKVQKIIRRIVMERKKRLEKREREKEEAKEEKEAEL